MKSKHFLISTDIDNLLVQIISKEPAVKSKIKTLEAILKSKFYLK